MRMDDSTDEEVWTTYQYITDLCERLDKITHIVKENMQEVKEKQAACFNWNAKECKCKL